MTIMELAWSLVHEMCDELNVKPEKAGTYSLRYWIRKEKKTSYA